MCNPQVSRLDRSTKIPMFCTTCRNEWDVVYKKKAVGGIQVEVRFEKIDDSTCVERLGDLLSQEGTPPEDLMAQIANLVRKTGRVIPDIYI